VSEWDGGNARGGRRRAETVKAGARQGRRKDKAEGGERRGEEGGNRLT
jgi:hypothetical protein